MHDFYIRVIFLYYILYHTKTNSRKLKQKKSFPNNHNIYTYTKIINIKENNSKNNEKNLNIKYIPI